MAIRSGAEYRESLQDGRAGRSHRLRRGRATSGRHGIPTVQPAFDFLALVVVFLAVR
jgi:hypothetical protein